LGVQGYYTAMKNCKAMIGNTSSGIVESATMGAWVLNLGDRQKGRSRNLNVTDVEFDQEAMWKYWIALPNDRYTGPNLYGDGASSQKIMDILKVNFDELR
jgi:GDP/UDP-N,N'-diacetylbacillosamine 2-epimerase (hydrolysing)